MYLRELEEQDAEPMLAWMHNPQVVRDLNADFASRTLEDCRAFIRQSRGNGRDLHLAIASEENEYMGTVSLKHIRHDTGSAEFAIVVRPEGMGKGFSRFAMNAMLEKAWEMGLETVYWCVSPKNERAVRFYNRNGFSRLEAPPPEADPDLSARKDLIWYEQRREKHEQ